MIFLPDPLFTYILAKLADIASGEIQLQRNVSSEVHNITALLHLMQAALRDVSEDGRLNHVYQQWGKEMKDVASRTEDVLELYMYDMGVVASKTSGNILTICSITTGFFEKMILRHHLHRDLETINGIIEVLKKKADFQLPETQPTTVRERHHQNSPVEASYVEKADVVGIDNEVDRIFNDVQEKGRSHLITVFGPGGSGKTTLVKRLYNKIVETGFDCHAWVTFPHQKVKENILKIIARDFWKSCRDPEPLEISDTDLVQQTESYLQQKMRYVLVLDNVWDTDVLENISRALPQEGSCSSIIIVTTREKTIVSGSLPGRPVECRVKPLTPAFGWDLFCRVAFKHSNPEGQCPKNLEEVGKSLLSKCQGLPLAVVAISGLMATKERNIEAWKEVRNTISPDLPRTLKYLNQCLLLSYDRLPLDLKYCALYFALLPKGMTISRKKLIRMWIAEGFIMSESEKTLEDTGKYCFFQLVDKSIITPTGSNKQGEPISGVMHDVMHDVIAHVAGRELFGTIVSSETENLNVGQRRLSLYKTEPAVENYVVTRLLLRSFLAFDCDGEPSGLLLHQILLSVKLLRVLILEGVDISALPDRLGDLIHLRYLSVRKTMIRTLPKSLGKLRHLQTLDVRETAVVSLPEGVSQLPHLRHLLIKKFQESREFTVLPKHGLKSKRLQTLAGVELTPHLLKKLDQMTQLRKLQLSSKGGECWTKLCHSLTKMTKLQSLQIQSVEGEQLHLGTMSPPASLRKLALRGIFKHREEWISCHDSIQVL